MIHQDVFIGIDVAKARFDIHIHPAGTGLSTGSTAREIAMLVRQLVKLAPAGVGLEASGGYERRLAGRLHAAGLKVFIMAPHRVRAFARATGRHAKTDRIDAQMIARCLAVTINDLHPHEPDATLNRLAELNAFRRGLRQEEARLAGQLDLAADPLVARLIRARQTRVKASVLLVEKQVRKLIAEDPRLKARFARLVKEPGVGSVLAATLLSDMPELGRMPAKAAASIIGVAPHARQSGASHRRGRCQGGRKQVRDVLYMAVLSLLKTRRGELWAFYARLREAGKPFKVAIVAAMRKLITRLNAIARDDPAFTT